MRRSLTFSPENERRIQGLRSTTLGLETPVDLDYTTATNMLVELGFLTLQQMGTLAQQGSTPVIPVSIMEVVRVLFGYAFQSMVTDTVPVEDQGQWAKDLVEKEGGVKLLMSFRNLSVFQPKKPPPEPVVEHMTVKPHSSPSKGAEQVPRKD
jgi:hypothetical protein